jgi:hypothetical protein
MNNQILHKINDTQQFKYISLPRSQAFFLSRSSLGAASVFFLSLALPTVLWDLRESAQRLYAVLAASGA